MSREQQIDHAPPESADRAPGAAQNSRAAAHGIQGWLRAKLRFIRTMLWVAVYATAALFLMALILLDGLRPKSKMIGSALIVELALIVASYGLQWNR